MEITREEMIPVPGQVYGVNALGLVVFSMCFGLIIGNMKEQGQLLRDFFDSLNEAIMRLVAIIMWWDWQEGSVALTTFSTNTGKVSYVNLWCFLSSSQVCSYWYPVPDCRKDCGDGWSDTDGGPAGHVYHHSNHWLVDPWRPYSSHLVFCHHSAEPLYLHCWASASSGHRPGDLLQVSLVHLIQKIKKWIGDDPWKSSILGAALVWA